MNTLASRFDDNEAIAQQMANQALVLEAVAKAMTYDLAIAPVVIAGTNANVAADMMPGLASSLGIRAINIGDVDTMTDIELDLPKVCPAIVTVTAENPGAMREIVGRIFETASSMVVLVIITSAEGEEAALRAIDYELGVRRAHVPTVRLWKGSQVSQPLLVTGYVTHESSKCGVRYFTVSVLPHDAIIQFTVKTEELTDDQLNEMIAPLYKFSVLTALRLEESDEGLMLGLNDFEVIEQATPF